jgi:hypothetical protein
LLFERQIFTKLRAAKLLADHTMIKTLRDNLDDESFPTTTKLHDKHAGILTFCF